MVYLRNWLNVKLHNMENSVSLKADQEFSLNLSHALKEYLLNKFDKKQPFSEESNTEFWDDISKNKTNENIFDLLKRCYPQLNFPIETGIEKSELYKEFVSRGKIDLTSTAASLELNDYKNIKLENSTCLAGKIPVLTILNEEDFVKIIQSLLHKNNPVEIPHSMGAVLINGINNWKESRL